VSERDDELSPAERRALDLWQAVEPPEDFHARVLGRLESTPQRRPLRQMAVAAAALILVGGLLAARLLTGGASTLGEVHLDTGDGGPSVEASRSSDGVRS
jgi:ferric-dicitrate binding protein FerR (iron transport regulator)